MIDSPLLNLPYLQSAQAQKHVTVNDSLRALDALVQLSVIDRTRTAPPSSPQEGDRHIVAPGAIGAWAGQDGRIAAYQDGAWSYYPPQTGWRAFIAVEDVDVIYDGSVWVAGVAGGLVSQSSAGAGLSFETLEEDHTLAAAAFSDTAMVIPDRANVLAVTTRVLTAISGAASWDLGVAGATNRYGSSIGVAPGSTVNGVSGSPVAYYGATPLRLTANGGDFSSGVVRIALHYAIASVPSA